MYRFEPAEGNNRTDLDIHLESCDINISTEEKPSTWPGLEESSPWPGGGKLGTQKNAKPWNPMNQWDPPPAIFTSYGDLNFIVLEYITKN